VASVDSGGLCTLAPLSDGSMVGRGANSPQFQFAQVDTSVQASIGVTTTGEIYA
jgi:hypothetical protein